jgi:uroporphyrinogen-III synthase
MTDHNVTGGTCRELTKYRITFAAALAALALAGWMFQTAYEQHIKILQIGNQTGELVQMRGLTTQEGAQHEQR